MVDQRLKEPAQALRGHQEEAVEAAELLGPLNVTGLDYEPGLIGKLLGYQYAYLPQAIHGEAVHSARTLPFQQDRDSLALQMCLDHIGSEFTLNSTDDHEI